MQWHGEACPWSGHGGTTIETDEGKDADQQVAYLQTLLYFLDKHVSVCCKAIRGENSTIGPDGGQNGWMMTGSDAYNRKTFGAYRVWML